MPSDAVADLGAYLTAAEARALATQFRAGRLTSQVLNAIGGPRRAQAQHLLDAAGLGHAQRDFSVAILTAIVGAKSTPYELTPMWTMPGNEAHIGHLTSEFHRVVSGARVSITCATYNFETSSAMWIALKNASEAAGIAVTVYFDDKVGNPAGVKVQLPHAQLWQPATLPNGKAFKSHAKFVIIDHQLVLLTSANFSKSAEQYNVELGLLVDDAGLADSIEQTMLSKHGLLYEVV